MGSTRRQVTPLTQRQAEQAVGISQSVFGGMTKDVPTTEVNEKYSFRNVNVVDHGQWFESRIGTRRYNETGVSGIDYDTYPLYGRHFNRLTKKIYSHCGNKVYQHDWDFTNMVEVVCCSNDLPALTPSTFDDYQDDVILFANGMWRISMLNGYPFMVKINCLNPEYVAPADVVSGDFFKLSLDNYSKSLRPDAKESYRYITSYGRITGGSWYNSNTDTSTRQDVEFLFETGTFRSSEKVANTNPYYELWVNKPINSSGDYVKAALEPYGVITVGELVVPYNRKDVTHHCIYRTKNIGYDSGNNPAQYIWVDDVPAAGIWFVDVTEYPFDEAGTLSLPNWIIGNTLQIADNGADFKRDVYAPLKATDTAGGWVSLLFDNVSGDPLPAGTYTLAVGGGNVAIVTCDDDTITTIHGDMFSSSDVGKTIFLTDGTINVITEYVSTTEVKVLNPFDSVSSGVGITWMGSDGFSVVYADTVMDDGKADNEEGLHERQLASNSIYYPQYSFQRMSDGDLGCVTNGILFSAKRGEQWIQYTAIGDKPYQAGCYDDVDQFDNLSAHVMVFAKQANLVSAVCSDRVMVCDLTQTITNVGNISFGEYIPKLPPFYASDLRIGCKQWRTLVPIAPGKWMAVTSEPAVRMFDGKSWSKDNYAALNGVPAIMEDLRNVGPCELMAAYSDLDGYIIFGERYSDAELVYPDEMIVETLMSGDWVDIGGDHSESTAFPRYLDVGGVRT